MRRYRLSRVVAPRGEPGCSASWLQEDEREPSLSLSGHSTGFPTAGRNSHGSFSINRKGPRRSGSPRLYGALSVGYVVGLVSGILPVRTTFSG